MDGDLTPAQRLILIHLLNFQYGFDGYINPSQETLAEELGLHEGTVSRSATALVAAGWLVKSRRNRNSTNLYEVLDDNVDQITDWHQIKKDERDERRKRESVKSKTSTNKPSPEPTKCHVDGASALQNVNSRHDKLSSPEPTKCHPITLMENSEVEYVEENMGVEESGSVEDQDFISEYDRQSNGW